MHYDCFFCRSDTVAILTRQKSKLKIAPQQIVFYLEAKYCLMVFTPSCRNLLGCPISSRRF